MSISDPSNAVPTPSAEATRHPTTTSAIDPSRPRWDAVTLASRTVIALAAGLYLVQQLGSVLRPLLFAVFLCYVLLPLHQRLSRHMSASLASGLIIVVIVGLGYLVGLMVYSNVVELNRQLPDYQRRGKQLVQSAIRWSAEYVPGTEKYFQNDLLHDVEQTLVSEVRFLLLSAAESFGSYVATFFIVVLYMMFLALEVRNVQKRIDEGFAPESAAQVAEVIRKINQAIADYLSIKIRASLLLALPVLGVMTILGIPFAMMWGVLTFLGNFVPYIGSVVCCGLPIVLALVQFDSMLMPLILAGLLIGIHVLCASVVEPALTGKAVGLSPLVVFFSVAFWGQFWGIPGMILAIPLTVSLKVILDHLPSTKKLAGFLAHR